MAAKTKHSSNANKVFEGSSERPRTSDDVVVVEESVGTIYKPECRRKLLRGDDTLERYLAEANAKDWEEGKGAVEAELQEGE